MADSVNGSMLPSISNAEGLTQSLFAPRMIVQTQGEPKTPATTTHAKQSKAFKLNVMRSSSAMKLNVLRQQPGITDATYSTTSGGAQGELSPVRKSKAKQASNNKFSIKTGSMSPRKLKTKSKKIEKPITVLIESAEEPMGISPLPIIESPGFLTVKPRRQNTGLTEDERTRTPSDRTPTTKGELTPNKIRVTSKANKYCCGESPTRKVKLARPNLTMEIDSSSNDHSYFVNHVRGPKAMTPMRNHVARDFTSLMPKSHIGIEYFKQAHSVISMMEYDRVVQRPRTIDFIRKFPNRKLLLLDLDETLIHCSGNLSLIKKFDIELDFVNDEGIFIPGLLNIRPHAQAFLKSMSKVYEVVIFTASMKYYADTILEVIDPKRQYVSNSFYRESCSQTSSGKLVKDLTVFGGVPLSDMLLVDNNIYCMWTHPNHGVPVLHFTFDRSDKELIGLESFLLDLVKYKDHSSILKKQFKIESLYKTRDISQFLSQFTKA